MPAMWHQMACRARPTHLAILRALPAPSRRLRRRAPRSWLSDLLPPGFRTARRAFSDSGQSLPAGVRPGGVWLSGGGAGGGGKSRLGACHHVALPIHSAAHSPRFPHEIPRPFRYFCAAAPGPSVLNCRFPAMKKDSFLRFSGHSTFRPFWATIVV